MLSLKTVDVQIIWICTFVEYIHDSIDSYSKEFNNVVAIDQTITSTVDIKFQYFTIMKLLVDKNDKEIKNKLCILDLYPEMWTKYINTDLNRSIKFIRRVIIVMFWSVLHNKI